MLRGDGTLRAADLRLDGTVSNSAPAVSYVTGDLPPAEGREWTLLQMERFHIERVLEQEDGHVERAARRLGGPRSSLYQKIKTFGLKSGPASRASRLARSALEAPFGGDRTSA